MTSKLTELHSVYTGIEAQRPEFRYIIDMVEPGMRVLDLGCGEGHLLKALQLEKRARVQGIENSVSAIQECIAKGLFAYQGDLDEGLADFNDGTFDYVILTNTLQVLHQPDLLIKEAARVGKKCIVAIPSFGYWKLRFYLLFRGRMPVTARLPYEWFNTPNIHLATLRDFQIFCDDHDLRILKQTFLLLGEQGCKEVSFLPNFFADYGIFLLEKK